jgi:hypothetical protein
MKERDTEKSKKNYLESTAFQVMRYASLSQVFASSTIHNKRFELKLPLFLYCFCTKKRHILKLAVFVLEMGFLCIDTN